MLNEELKQILIDNGLPNRDQMPYCVTVHKPYGQLNVVLKWCRGHYSNRVWGWRMETMPGADNHGKYNFYFEQEQNAFEFALRWAN